MRKLRLRNYIDVQIEWAELWTDLRVNYLPFYREVRSANYHLAHALREQEVNRIFPWVDPEGLCDDDD
jgi:hypothetical protein